MNPRLAIAFLVICVAGVGAYWKYRANEAAAEARLLEEKARAAKMEAEIARLKAEMAAQDDSARTRMIEQQQERATT